MKRIAILLFLVGCGGEPIALKANGVECSDSAECESGFCGTAEIHPSGGACMPIEQ